MSSSLTKPTAPGSYPQPNPNVSQIPAPTANLPALAFCVLALKQAVDNLCGFRGKNTNRAVTFDDLVAFRIITAAAAISPYGTAVSSGTTGGSGSSVITSVDANFSIDVNNELHLANIPSGQIISNGNTVSAEPAPATLSTLLDLNFGNTQGGMLVRGVSNWGTLTPGTQGQILAEGAGPAPQFQNHEVQGTGTIATTNTINAVGLQSFQYTVAGVAGSIDINNGYAGQQLSIHIVQGATAHAVTLSSHFALPTATTFTSGAANKRDVLKVECVDGTNWVVTAIEQGYTV